MLGVLQNQNPKLRKGAAIALGQIKDHGASQPLIAALNDRDAGVRISAAWALAEINDPSAVEPLLSVYQEKKLDLIAGAEKFFIKRGEPGSEPILIEALNRYGDGQMAQDFLNCGNEQLENAAEKWAEAHKVRIIRITSFGSSSLRWGSAPK